MRLERVVTFVPPSTVRRLEREARARGLPLERHVATLLTMPNHRGRSVRGQWTASDEAGLRRLLEM